MTTHKWGDNAQSPCGLPVAMAYSTNDVGFTSEWKDVDCPNCLQAFVDQQKAAAERRARAAEEPLYMKAARSSVQHQLPSLPWVVEALLKRIDILQEANRPTSDRNETPLP